MERNRLYKKYCEKYRDTIPYLFFGVLTTGVNMAVYGGAAHLLHLPVLWSTALAWVLAVLFAYLTNRKWVFCSRARTAREVFGEISSFFGCRIATGILDGLCMLVFVDWLHQNDIIIKAGANVVVIVLNYLASKWLIFRRKS